MHSLEFKNYKALRSKNFTYSELVQVFSSPLFLTVFLCSSVTAIKRRGCSRQQIQAEYPPPLSLSQPGTLHWTCSSSTPPLLPHFLQNISRKKATWKADRSDCETAIAHVNCEVVCVSFHLTPLMSLTVSIWSYAPSLCYTLWDISALAVALKASALNHFCETLFSGKKHRYGWNTTQVSASSEQVYMWDMLYLTFSSFSLSSYIYLKAIVNVQDLFPYS